MSGMSASLMGTYNHVMDAKGRMSFPTKLREILGAGFVVTTGVEGCLYVYSAEEWTKFTEKLSTLSGAKGRQLIRKFAANADTPEVDKQGRILIPQTLRNHAGLSHDITVIGALNHAEIWDTAQYEEYNSSFSEEELADALSELAI